MSAKKKDLKDLVAGDKVVLVKRPLTDSYLGYYHEVGDVFTVREKGSGYATPVCKVVGRYGIEYTSCKILNEYLEHYVEEQNMFTKNDLKTGMWVEFRGAGVGVVVEVDGQIHVYDHEWSRGVKTTIKNGYSDDMVATATTRSLMLPGWDIMKVWDRSPNMNDLFRPKYKGKILYERVEPPVKTEQQLAHEKLMSQIAELEEKTKELREQAKKLGEAK